ncbi:hypothetical protein [Dysgonomonas macrotermitis]|uniref:Archaemetzincin n=1 Tax=Dysgonomonas macrotermitis TaxID=1346286 RepID=A0A1M5EZP7_9BACT|nr:hypothetical protein [Dysgonomonas macrotermitis]SHF84755.1 archaemetzincin [Dysgonomonas macrotermitis]
MKGFTLFIVFFFLLFWGACGNVSQEGKIAHVEPRPIVIQPIGGFPDKQAQVLLKMLKEVNPNVSVAQPIPMYNKAYFEPLHRYRADSLLHYLYRKSYRRKDAIVLGLTYKDISTTTHGYYDYGVMGLARSPGNVCIISTHRLSKRKKYYYNQMFKVAIHELAHTEGLGHCDLSNTCYMKDWKYKSPTLEEDEFCITCKTYLQKKGWRLK